MRYHIPTKLREILMRTSRFIAGLSVILFLQLPAIRAAAEEPAFARFFTAEHKQLVAINDPLPHVQRMLASPSLRKVLLEGKIAQLISVHQPGLRLDPAIASAFLQQNE